MQKNMNTQHIKLNVPLNFNQVVDIVRQLSPKEKQQLSEVLWTETDLADIEIPEEHKAIVRQRIKKYENSPESYFTWDDIERKMKARK
jgi:hypothetical protein